MCNGTGRASQGGRIVVLQPLPSTSISTTSNPRLPPSKKRELSLRLDDDLINDRTTVTLEGMEPGEMAGRRRQVVVIHRDGDLTSSRSRDGNDDDESVLHRFEVPSSNFTTTASGRASFSLARRFDLGVGGEGIVGRRVSLMRDQLVVGQGIVGWN